MPVVMDKFCSSSLTGNATDSQVAGLTLPARQSLADLVDGVIVATNKWRCSANRLLLEFDGHGGGARSMQIQQRRVLLRRRSSVPNRSKQIRSRQVFSRKFRCVRGSGNRDVVDDDNGDAEVHGDDNQNTRWSRKRCIQSLRSRDRGLTWSI
jgi:hypothetical protein